MPIPSQFCISKREESDSFQILCAGTVFLSLVQIVSIAKSASLTVKKPKSRSLIIPLHRCVLQGRSDKARTQSGMHAQVNSHVLNLMRVRLGFSSKLRSLQAALRLLRVSLVSA